MSADIRRGEEIMDKLKSIKITSREARSRANKANDPIHQAFYYRVAIDNYCAPHESGIQKIDYDNLIECYNDCIRKINNKGGEV